MRPLVLRGVKHWLPDDGAPVTLCGEVHVTAEMRRRKISKRGALSPMCKRCEVRLGDPVIQLTVGPRVMEAIRYLLAGGLHGITLERVAEGLLLDGLRRAMSEGWCPAPGTLRPKETP